MNIERILEIRYYPPGTERLNYILEKLDQHEKKLRDLSAKLNDAFDKLKAKHIHTLLSEAHQRAAQLQQTYTIHRESFKTKMEEEKAHRAQLRRQFYMYRTGKYPAAI
ncbi:hypothetical protein BDQ12DRAFT_673891 [Crucibulum laeve]|uniref:Uncharacterized protein n=1 Tax=Crucibulum laeve TaxID=68775 RepID=A0A5C3MJW3_9AGAR|nr:hypothetical protein BDQ12DRAFT_673891 [Crucibulum laeve]